MADKDIYQGTAEELDETPETVREERDGLKRALAASHARLRKLEEKFESLEKRASDETRFTLSDVFAAPPEGEELSLTSFLPRLRAGLEDQERQVGALLTQLAEHVVEAKLATRSPRYWDAVAKFDAESEADPGLLEEVRKAKDPYKARYDLGFRQLTPSEPAPVPEPKRAPTQGLRGSGGGAGAPKSRALEAFDQLTATEQQKFLSDPENRKKFAAELEL